MCSTLVGRPVEVVRSARALIDALAGVSPDGVLVFDQRSVVTGLTELIERLSAVRAVWLAAVAADASLKLEGHRNAGVWLSSATGLTPAEAGRAVRQAEAAVRMPEVLDAWTAGEINGSAVSLLGTVADQPGFTDAAGELLDTARTAPGALGKAVTDFDHAQRSRQSLDEQNRRRRERRCLTLTRQSDGMTRLEGLLQPEAASRLKKSLATLMTPDPAGAEVVRTFTQRQADALVELCVRGAAKPGAPVDDRPRIVILTPHDALAAHSTVPARTTFGDVICGEDLRRLACDAILDRVTIDGDGLPLDVGRSVYSPPAHIRRAVIARDQGCIWPGCNVPADECEVHHVVHWADDGHTKVRNLSLGCGGHHPVFHQPGWDIRFIDGRPRIFTPDGRMLPSNHDRLVTRPNQRPPDPPPGEHQGTEAPPSGTTTPCGCDHPEHEPAPARPHPANETLSLFSP